MDRSEWLTTVYREANLFLEAQQKANRPVKLDNIDDYDNEIHAQIQEILSEQKELEHLIMHSVLKTPPADLWQTEDSWPRVLIAVAGECMVYDVKGVAKKILAGDLPRVPSHTLHEQIKAGRSMTHTYKMPPSQPRMQAIKDVDPDNEEDEIDETDHK